MEIKIISAIETIPLRQKILWPELSLDACVLEEDGNGIHFGAYINQRLVAVVSVFIQRNQAQLRKFAVDTDCQGRGIGAQMIQHIENYLAAFKLSALWCDARAEALGFYKKLGFEVSPMAFKKKGLDYHKASKSFRL